MAKYIVDLTKFDNESLLGLVNNDNAGTIGVELTLDNTIVSDLTAITEEPVIRQVYVEEVDDDLASNVLAKTVYNSYYAAHAILGGSLSMFKGMLDTYSFDTVLEVNTKFYRFAYLDLAETNGVDTTGYVVNTDPVRPWGATLTNAEYAKDKVDVRFNRIAVGDVMDMTLADGDFDWYNYDDWNQVRDIPLAVAAFKTACTRFGVDADRTMRNVTAERYQVGSDWHIAFTMDSYVLEGGRDKAAFRLPKFFSEMLTATVLDGFTFTPIQPEEVVE